MRNLSKISLIIRFFVVIFSLAVFSRATDGVVYALDCAKYGEDCWIDNDCCSDWCNWEWGDFFCDCPEDLPNLCNELCYTECAFGKKFDCIDGEVSCCENECLNEGYFCLDAQSLAYCENNDQDQCLEAEGFASCACLNGECIDPESCDNACLDSGDKLCIDDENLGICMPPDDYDFSFSVCYELVQFSLCEFGCEDGQCLEDPDNDTPDIDPCENECFVEGLDFCLSGSTMAHCGYFDSDSCLDAQGYLSCVCNGNGCISTVENCEPESIEVSSSNFNGLTQNQEFVGSITLKNYGSGPCHITKVDLDSTNEIDWGDDDYDISFSLAPGQEKSISEFAGEAIDCGEAEVNVDLKIFGESYTNIDEFFIEIECSPMCVDECSPTEFLPCAGTYSYKFCEKSEETGCYELVDKDCPSEQICEDGLCKNPCFPDNDHKACQGDNLVWKDSCDQITSVISDCSELPSVCDSQGLAILSDGFCSSEKLKCQFKQKVVCDNGCLQGVSYCLQSPGCEIENVIWSKDKVTDGQEVKIIIVSNGYCNGKDILIEIREEDLSVLPDDYLEDFTYKIYSPMEEILWRAKYVHDAANIFEQCSGSDCIFNPEFNVRIWDLDSSDILISDSSNILTVEPFKMGMSFGEYEQKVKEQLLPPPETPIADIINECYPIIIPPTIGIIRLSVEELISSHPPTKERCWQVLKVAKVEGYSEEVEYYGEVLLDYWENGWDFIDPSYWAYFLGGCLVCSYPEVLYKAGVSLVVGESSELKGVHDEGFDFRHSFFGPSACKICFEGVWEALDNPQIEVVSATIGLCKMILSVGLKKIAPTIGATVIDDLGMSGMAVSKHKGKFLIQNINFANVGSSSTYLNNELKLVYREITDPIWLYEGGSDFIKFNYMEKGLIEGVSYLPKKGLFLGCFNKLKTAYNQMHALFSLKYADELANLRIVTVKELPGFGRYANNTVTIGVDPIIALKGIAREDFVVAVLKHEMGHFIQEKALVRAGYSVQPEQVINEVVEYANNLYIKENIPGSQTFSKAIANIINPEKKGSKIADLIFRFDSLEGVEKYNLHAFYAYADDFDIPGLKDHIKQNFKLVYSKERFDLFEQEVLVMKQELSEFNEFVNLPEIYNYKKKELDDIIEKYRLYLGVVALPSFSGEIEPHSAETIGGYDFVCVRDVVWFRKTDSSQLIQKITDCSLYGQICEQGRCVEADLNDGDTDNFFEDSKSSFSGHDINSSMEKEVEKVEHAQMGSSPSVSSECSMNRNNRSNKISLILLSLLLLGLFSLREGRE